MDPAEQFLRVVVLLQFAREYENNLVSLVLQPLNKFENAQLDPPYWRIGVEVCDKKNKFVAGVHLKLGTWFTLAQPFSIVLIFAQPFCQVWITPDA
jgi:hypothetical protein